MGENVVAAPVMAAEGRSFTLRGWMVVVATIVSLFMVGVLGTWSASADYGGVDEDGHWIDASGVVVAAAPATVRALGHPSPLAVTLIVLVGLLGVVVPPTLARWGRERLGRTVRVAAVLALPVLAVAAVLVYGVWESHVVMDQIQQQVLPVHAFPLSGTTITTGHMTR
ncbi:hypothetical protein BIU98_16915 [Curtobacterium sp. MMLR14_010]|uniref:hypothetical protein n=1 Tax=Curtobacterium sp. MMLR14_010 TaxID=1898743 RepID=UPI0008DE0699|nr:hypothetical protein [Curtobacterium sp. MMLR14_010]OII36732.1 hypothetical protein BIU98_16915 [Curtobacterium sp. MMLR14_010]